jgi:hypothetical protein
MDPDRLFDATTSLSNVENWVALGGSAPLLHVGTSRRFAVGASLASSSAPLLYRGISGHWPALAIGFSQPDNTTTGPGGERGVHVHESIRLEVPRAERPSSRRE